MHRPLRKGVAFAALSAVLCAALASTAQEMDDVEIEGTEVRPGIHMLTGRGGNIGVSAGADGIVLIDDQYAPLTPKILAVVASIQAGPVRFVLNTHWHGDHTGGNERLGGSGALIVAHHNVRERMSAPQFMKIFDRRVPASPAAALPVVTFGDDFAFHLNGDELHVFHVPAAHTDGDAVVHFRKANVLHTGDLFLPGRYPFIDVDSGGSLDGLIAGADRILALCDTRTRLIPGHGPLSNRSELQQFRDMLGAVRERVSAEIAAGRSLDELLAARPLADFDGAFGAGFIDPERFLRTVYASLSASAGD